MKIRNIIFVVMVFVTSCERGRILSDKRIIGKMIEKENNVKHIYDKQKRLVGTLGIFLGHNYRTQISYLNNNHVREITGFVSDDPFGHWFQFYTDGTLKEYSFLLFKKKSRYVLTFNENGTVNNSYGTPLVLHYLDTEKQFSSAMFSTGIFDSLHVKYSFDKVNYKKLVCNKFRGYPMLYEGKLPLSKQRTYYEIEAYISENRVVYLDSVDVDW